MAQPCLFCDNIPGSREHLWPAWIHRRKDFGPIRLQRGMSPEVIVHNPQQTVKTVCGTCNGGWMSSLEAENIPLIGSMFQDISIPLDAAQQHSVAVWAMKTAMMLESTKGRNAANGFYTHEEGLNLRVSRTIPDRTRIWIGRISEQHLGASGTDFTIQTSDGKRLGMGSVATITVGHFVVQVVTTHIDPEYAAVDIPDVQPKPGDWDKMLLKIWPSGRQSLDWPPQVSFTNGGPLGSAFLLDRWRVGGKVAKVTKVGVVG